MFYIKREGEEVRKGIGIYHPQDPSSAGIFIRIGNHILRLRWSKIAKRFFGGYVKIDPLAMEKLAMWNSLHGFKQ